MKFVDLFAGLGGFHQALESLGHTCVFASELDTRLASLYKSNFGITPFGDIRSHWQSVPEHDILCAGFPCQPFSKAGSQLGFDCPQWGDLFEYVLKILNQHRPRFLMIENVPNLMKHAGGETWLKVESRLRDAGYDIASSKLSPHMFGVPQVRDRAIIVGDRRGLTNFRWPERTSIPEELHISRVLDVHPVGSKSLSEKSISYITAWQSLLDALPASEALPSFPLWAMEFGATYPYDHDVATGLSAKDLKGFRGNFGVELSAVSEKDRLMHIPTYARSAKPFPKWKINFIKDNRAFYSKHHKVIDAWLPKIDGFYPSFQKLEWNWKGGPRDLWQTVIQFRASGIRAKRPTTAPSLVALTTSQIPIIAWEQRYMTPRECARLQSMGNLKHLPSGEGASHRALGNAVNVEVMRRVGSALLHSAGKITAQAAE